MRLLKVTAADFGTGNLRRNGQHRHTAAMAIVEPVDQVKIARPATARTHGQFARQVSLGAGGKRSHLFMSHVQPFNLFALADRIGQSFNESPATP